MRTILFPATVLGAAAMAAAAPAQPAPNGHVQYPAASRMADQGGHAFGGHRDFRPGMDWGRRHGRPGGHDRRHGGFGRGGQGVPYPFAAYGIDGDYESVDPHGTGFFAGAGGRVRFEDGRPYYDYDRAYPYEWASAAGGGRGDPDRGEEGWTLLAPRCSVENRVRVCRGNW